MRMSCCGERALDKDGPKTVSHRPLAHVRGVVTPAALVSLRVPITVQTDYFKLDFLITAIR